MSDILRKSDIFTGCVYAAATVVWVVAGCMWLNNGWLFIGILNLVVAAVNAFAAYGYLDSAKKRSDE